jgi:hypothetical protein
MRLFLLTQSRRKLIHPLLRFSTGDALYVTPLCVLLLQLRVIP